MTFSLETIAVAAALLYLILAIRQNIWCWAAAAISTSLYLHILFAAGLYMQSALQVFYLLMAAYGWYQWRGGKSSDKSRDDQGREQNVNEVGKHSAEKRIEKTVDAGVEEGSTASGEQAADTQLQITTWTRNQHLLAILFILGMTLVNSLVLSRFTAAAMPLLDSFTTWGSIVATYMVARKVFENWHYWFVIDSVSIYLFASQKLFPTAALFAVYLVLIVIGWRTWKKDLNDVDTVSS